MPVICWGPLAQSANDTTTIAEYIQGQILEHNVDPSAHGLDDYAIWNHRTDEVLDHADYSVTSDKITASQIIGKHFTTDPNVGPSVDGIEFDRNAISMWYQTKRKVYIPRTGDPEFEGVVSLEGLKYLKNIITLSFEGTDIYTYTASKVNFSWGCLEVWTAFSAPFNASLRLFVPPIQSNFWDSNPSIDFYFATPLYTGHEQYFGMGDMIEEDYHNLVGFHSVGGVLYACNYLSSPNQRKETQITNIFPYTLHRGRASVISGSRSEFFIDDVLRAVHYVYIPNDTDNDVGCMFQVFTRNKNENQRSSILIGNIVITKDF